MGAAEGGGLSRFGVGFSAGRVWREETFCISYGYPPEVLGICLTYVHCSEIDELQIPPKSATPPARTSLAPALASAFLATHYEWPPRKFLRLSQHTRTSSLPSRMPCSPS